MWSEPFSAPTQALRTVEQESEGCVKAALRRMVPARQPVAHFTRHRDMVTSLAPCLANDHFEIERAPLANARFDVTVISRYFPEFERTLCFAIICWLGGASACRKEGVPPPGHALRWEGNASAPWASPEKAHIA